MYKQIIKISMLLSILLFSSGCMFKSNNSIPVTFMEEVKDVDGNKTLTNREAVLTTEEYEQYYKDLLSGKKQKVNTTSNLLNFSPEKTTKKCEKNESDKMVFSLTDSKSYIKSIKNTTKEDGTVVVNIENGELLQGNDYVIEFCRDENGVIIGEFNLNVYEIKDEDLK